ncbi:unnamed protein product [Linum trigynum]|uniref:Ribosomal protein L34Ae n=1 Tax=Linum trigynum TaxID=586398 RepID=A0AAV2DCN6_9ROSI
MQHCSKERLVWLFYNASSFSLLLFLFLYSSISLLLTFLSFIGSYPILYRDPNEEYVFTSDEEEEAEEEEEEKEDHNDAYYHQSRSPFGFTEFLIDPTLLPEEEEEEDQGSSYGSGTSDELFSSVLGSSPGSESGDVEDQTQIHTADNHHADALPDSVPNRQGPTSRVTINLQETTTHSAFLDPDATYAEKQDSRKKNKEKAEEFRTEVEEKFLVFEPTQLDSRKFVHQATQWKDIIDDDDRDDEREEIFGDSCTVGSTSKSSTEWRSSIKDSGTEDPFSSSSRRSCPKWESYTVFQKYDEEMIFLNRISAQKLQETESLRSIKVCPRSISDRIVHKIATINKKPSELRQNPYHELESAYVAQICLTWEALNWNYISFLRKRATERDFDPGCPAHIAQQFQQFQVLLQRYVENEPYEQGRRPEVYARMRLLAPKLLLVPEYRDTEEDQKDEGFSSRITSAAFLMIMEDGIRTFMCFLKADKERPCQIIASFFKRNRRALVDPALLNLMKKVNRKKKMKLKDLRRSGKCLRKRKLKVEEEMEILMGLIDLQVVSRVLRTSDLSEQQLHWCEEKMSKVRVMDGKLKRDPSPLFFPAH